jgi:hypothetical protein
VDSTPRQVEFREKLSALLGEYAAIVGPEFDGGEQGEAVEMPVPVRWLLVTEWNDVVDPDNGPWVILGDSGIHWIERMGLIHAGRHMIEDCD